MSRVASSGNNVGVASGALRRLLAALTCFGFSMGIVSCVFVMHGDGVAGGEGLVQAFVEALVELLPCFFTLSGFDHDGLQRDCTNRASTRGGSQHALRPTPRIRTLAD